MTSRRNASSMDSAFGDWRPERTEITADAGREASRVVREVGHENASRLLFRAYITHPEVENMVKEELKRVMENRLAKRKLEPPVDFESNYKACEHIVNTFNKELEIGNQVERVGEATKVLQDNRVDIMSKSGNDTR